MAKVSRDMTGINQTGLPLATLSESGKVPTKRIATAEDAQAVVQAFIDSNSGRAWFNAKIKGGIDGNPPYNKALMKANAQSHRANVNFMEMDAAVSAAKVPYYDLFAGSQFYCDVKLYLDNPDDQEAKSGIVTEEFDCLLKKYQGFEFQMNGVIHDFVAFGKGFTMFPNKWGWHFQRVACSRVFVADGTDASVEKQETVVVLEKMQLHTLWKSISNRETATAAGWKPTAGAEAIRHAMPEDPVSIGTLSYDYVQQQMRDRDIVLGTKMPTVAVAHLLTTEFDGTITHQIVEQAPRPVSGASAGVTPKADFIFEKRGRFEHMRQVLNAFFFETEDGSWNGARGLGHKVYAPFELKNRVLNSEVDHAFLTSGVTVQANDASALQKLNVVRVGTYTILPPGFTVQNAQIFSNNQPLMEANQLLEQIISSNTGVFRSKMEKPQGNPRTAKEVEIQFQNATVLSSSGVSRFYRQIDPLYVELYRRVTMEELLDGDKSEEAEAVREFRKRCLKRGVTLAEMRKVESVKACRNIGNGSQQQRTRELQEFEPFVPMLPESGKQNWMQLVVASKFGQSMVERLVPPRDKQLLPNDQQAMALLENAALKAGAPVAWTPTQNNVIHATEHLKAMSGAANSLEQGAEPIDVLAFLESAGPHVQEHMSRLQTDPSRKLEFQLLDKQFKQLAKFADELHGHVQEAQQAEQEKQKEQQMAQAKAQAIQNGTDPEIAIKQAQAAFDMQLKGAKAEQALQIKDQAHRQKLAVKDLDFAQKMRQQEQSRAE